MRVPDTGYFGSLLSPDRWMLAGAAGRGTRATIELDLGYLG